MPYPSQIATILQRKVDEHVSFWTINEDEMTDCQQEERAKIRFGLKSKSQF